MRKHIAITAMIMACLVLGCDRADLDFRGFTADGERIYPGTVSHVMVFAGNHRTGLAWNPSPDPSVRKYVIYWNNRRDSLELPVDTRNPQDTVLAVIPNLQEYIYSFVIQSLDGNGNRSIPKEVNNVRVYGTLYQERLLNRPFNADEPYTIDGGSVTLHFIAPDTTNTSTEIVYTNTDDATVSTWLLPSENTVTLTDFKPGSAIRYRSSYIPQRLAIDTFTVSEYDTYPTVYRDVVCDKSIFAEIRLPHDVGTYEPGTSISKLWDGSIGPQGYPNIFHSDGNTALPHHFTFDLGQVYPNLIALEETGRDCCNNPTEFEVWGIDDITDAATALPGNDAGWMDEARGKGWVLLADVVRGDDGSTPLKINLVADPPPVRYIRIRVKRVATGNSHYSNISELTFWNRQ